MRTANIAALALTCFLAGTSLHQDDVLPTGTLADNPQFRVNCGDMQTIRITDQEYYKRLEGVEMDGTEAIQICEKFLIEEQGMEKVELSSIKMVLEGIPQYVAEFFTQHTNRRKVVKHRRYMLQVGVLGKQVKASFISYRLPGSIPKGEMKEMENGMLFNDISVGDGEMVRPGATVRIDYVLSLLDGKLITNTHTQNTSRVFRLESAPFKGMADGLIGMRANGKRKLVIPPSLGYGAEGAKHIPADSTLVIDLVLKSVQ